jgi:hypothetical protein
MFAGCEAEFGADECDEVMRSLGCGALSDAGDVQPDSAKKVGRAGLALMLEAGDDRLDALALADAPELDRLQRGHQQLGRSTCFRAAFANCVWAVWCARSASRPRFHAST